MKYMLAALLALGVVSTGIVQAQERRTHIIKKKKPSVYKKTSKPAARSAKVQSHRKKAQPKKTIYKNVTKRAVHPEAAEIQRPVAAKVTQPVATPKTTEPTAYQKLEGWLGLGTGAAAATAATKAATVDHHRVAGHHTGPRKEKWNHRFESYWGHRGFEEGVNQNGHWVFGSYRPNWWEENYPIYWKDVVGPLYRKSAEYQTARAQIGK